MHKADTMRSEVESSELSINMDHREYGKVRSKALHWAVDRLALRLIAHRLIGRVDIGEMPDASQRALHPTVLIHQASLSSVPGQELRVEAEVCLACTLCLVFSKLCAVVLECGLDELAPTHSIEKAEVNRLT